MLLVDKGRANNDSDEAKRTDLSSEVTEKQNIAKFVNNLKWLIRISSYDERKTK